MRYLTTVMSLAVCALLAAPAAHAALIFTDDFSGGHGEWESEGLITFDDEMACLFENEYYWYSALWQAVALEAGAYRISFDFLGNLSPEIPDGTGPDVFFASLYFINDPDAFGLASYIFDDALPLFDLDSVGPYNIEGAVTESALGNGWQHFSMIFTNAYAYAIPVFELWDGNWIAGDSSVCIDNMSIVSMQQDVVIPEPASIVLLGLGVLGIAGRSGRRFFRR